MLSFINGEFKDVFRFLRENSREAIVVCFGTLFLSLAYYHQIGNEWLSSLLFFFIFPVLVIMLLLRKNPLNYGLRFGEPKVWGFHSVVFCLIAFLILFFSTRNPELKDYYGKAEFSFIGYFFITFARLFSSEFLFRGFLLFGLKDKLKEGSILVQTIPFVLVHFSKPEIETLSCIVTGLYFGYIAYRGKSFWPAFIVHMFINVYFVAAVNL